MTQINAPAHCRRYQRSGEKGKSKKLAERNPLPYTRIAMFRDNEAIADFGHQLGHEVVRLTELAKSIADQDQRRTILRKARQRDIAYLNGSMSEKA